MKWAALAVGFLVLLGGSFFILRAVGTREVVISRDGEGVLAAISSVLTGGASSSLLEATTTPDGDAPPQTPLANPPVVVKGIYLTGWTAGSSQKVARLIELAKQRGWNSMIIDIKDYSGYVSYKTGIPEVAATGAEEEPRILFPNKLIKQLHENNIYVVGRITVFQDPILAKAHPEWAVHSKATGGVWKDRKGIAWIDASSKDVWRYVAAIAKDAQARGFDEINFDYIRFPSDGVLSDMKFVSWDGSVPKHKVIGDFFAFLRQELQGGRISVDLFGLATINYDDLGIGQVIEDAYASFDYVSPMVYPSHYATGFLGYKNPADFPYEVVQYSMEHAYKRLQAYGMPAVSATSSTSTVPVPVPAAHPSSAKLRPWLQYFDLGAVYGQDKINAQIRAVDDVLQNGSNTDRYAGYLLWDPKNIYR